MINKKELYENIMKDISKIIKKSLNEYSSYEDDYEDYDP